MPRSVVVLVWIPLVLTACARSGQILVQDRRALAERVSLEAGCDRRHVYVTRLHGELFQVEACGVVREFEHSTPDRQWKPIEPLESRVRGDWACTSTILIRAPEPLTRQVYACERTATYALVYSQNRWSWRELARDEPHEANMSTGGAEEAVPEASGDGTGSNSVTGSTERPESEPERIHPVADSDLEVAEGDDSHGL